MPFPEPLNWSWSTSLMKIDLHYMASMIKPWIPHTLCNANSLLCLNVPWWFKLVCIVTIFNPSVHSRGKRYLINDFCDHTTGGKAPMSDTPVAWGVSHMKDNDLLSFFECIWLTIKWCSNSCKISIPSTHSFQFQFQYSGTPLERLGKSY